MAFYFCCAVDVFSYSPILAYTSWNQNEPKKKHVYQVIVIHSVLMEYD